MRQAWHVFVEEMKNRDLWHNVGRWLLGNLNLVPLLYMGDHILFLCRISVSVQDGPALGMCWSCAGETSDARVAPASFIA